MLTTALAIAIYFLPARPMTPQMVLASMAAEAGWSKAEVKCAEQIVWRESRWHADSQSKTTSAYGLFQIKKLRKGTPAPYQVAAGIRYIAHRHHNSPCLALAFHKRHGWY